MNKQSVYRFICMTLVLMTATAGAQIADGLTAYWNMNDSASDISGNGNNGSLMGGATWVEGLYGGALNVNGVDGYLDCGNDDSLDIREQLTLAAWVHTRDAANGQHNPFVTKGDHTYAIKHASNNSIEFFVFVGSWHTLNYTVDSSFNEEWHHVAGTYDGQEMILYIDGMAEITEGQSGQIDSDAGRNVNIGRNAEASDRFYDGLIDEVYIYDRALTAAEISVLMQGPDPYPFAYAPTPPDGALVRELSTTISWAPGVYAESHQVYFGSDREAVAAGDTSVALGNLTETEFDTSLEAGTTYYWRIDEINAGEPNSPWVGPVWQFTVPPFEAYDPVPGDGAEYYLTDLTLAWQPGLNSLLHTVHIGTDADEVANAVSTTLQVESRFTPDNLHPGTTYYWRVDEFSGAQTHKGQVWSFSTVPEIDPASDPNLQGHWTFDQVNAGVAVDWSGHGLHGTITGDPQWVSGPAGNAIALDGDDAFLTGAPENVSTNTATMCAWINPDKVHGWTGLLFSRGSGTYGLNLKGSNQLSYHWPVTEGTTGWEFDSGLVLTMNEWSFIALVVEPTKASLYLNGQDLWAANGGSHDEVDFVNPLHIGQDPQGGRWFTGQLDDIRFYTRSLTGEEIDAVMAEGSPPSVAPNPLMIEDFDGYRAYMTEDDPNVWDVWIDGYDNPNNGSTSGYLDPPFMQRTVTADAGGQSLPVQYNNLTSAISAVTRSFAPVVDLSAGGATKLMLYVRGDANNNAETGTDQVVLTLQSGGQTQDIVLLAAADIGMAKWQEVTIDLSSLTIDVTQVDTLSISVGTAGGTGGSGVIYVDNIQRSL